MSKLRGVKILFSKCRQSSGIALFRLIIWVFVIGLLIVYVPRAYDWYVKENTIKIIKSNVETVETGIKTLLIEKHPVIIWNDIDDVIKSLGFQNPITRETQIQNGWSRPGDVVVYFDGIDTFTLDGIDPDGEFLYLNITIKK